MAFSKLLAPLEKFYYEIWRDISALGGAFFTSFVVLVALAADELILSVKLVSGLLIVYFTGIAIRHYYFRARPSPERYSGWLQKIYASAFPSLHALRIWIIITLLAFHFNSQAFSIMLILAGLAVNYSRVYLNKHHTVDVAAGTLIGILAALFVEFVL